MVAASAGGIQGLGTLLGGLSGELPAVVLVVQHLRRGRETQIVSVLTRRTDLAVKLAQDGEEPVPGTVYIAPPDRHLCVRTAGKLALTEEGPVKSARPAADPLFESAAKAYGEKAIACVLTGTDGDGAQGITAVKAHGGTVLVQDPDTAQFQGMPRSAINTGLVDLVLPLKDIAPTITRFVRR
ncbi:chemotaxis protein CheB [Streptomyces sp. NPDC102467]|uniref:chemotaxis protein CheB n=1 Tax=Streptomyces sp. NPDC102467 TaxID=3366179 RepID=UPI0038123787